MFLGCFNPSDKIRTRHMVHPCERSLNVGVVLESYLHSEEVFLLLIQHSEWAGKGVAPTPVRERIR